MVYSSGKLVRLAWCCARYVGGGVGVVFWGHHWAHLPSSWGVVGGVGVLVVYWQFCSVVAMAAQAVSRCSRSGMGSYQYTWMQLFVIGPPRPAMAVPAKASYCVASV